MKRLLEYTIELVEDLCHSQYEEEKVSSSSLRKRLLGTVYNPLKVSQAAVNFLNTLNTFLTVCTVCQCFFVSIS